MAGYTGGDGQDFALYAQPPPMAPTGTEMTSTSNVYAVPLVRPDTRQVRKPRSGTGADDSGTAQYFLQSSIELT